LGEYEKAALDLQQARLLDPELEDTWEFLARAYTRADHFQEALQTLDEALQRFPTNLYLYDALSETYKDMGDFTSACQPLLQLIQRDGTNPIWWGKLIGSYQLAGDSVNASRYYQEALRRGIAL
jgi:predicted Zn-dependent protease